MPDESVHVLPRVEAALNAVILGQKTLIRQFMVGVLAGGHLLLEGLPGLGKTQLVRAFAGLCGLETRRIQFTPDLMPLDITGSNLLRETPAGKAFEFHRGPIFANLVLADEINRASPKTQAALLEAMQERQVTVLGDTHPLPRPFSVLATQNPIELEGTYPLPEAQLDRFLFKLDVEPVSTDVMKALALGTVGELPPADPMLTADGLSAAIARARKAVVTDPVADYVARLVISMRAGGEGPFAKHIKFGASPRAAMAMAAAARARATLDGRDTVGFDDVKEVAAPVLRHRLILNYQARLDGVNTDAVVAEALGRVAVLGRSAPDSLAARIASGA